MVVLDLSAAFDTVNHKILLDDLNKYFGIEGTLVKRIKSYLTSMQFLVQIEGKLSNVRTIGYSFAQGSIRGHVLFTCYVSTLQELFTTQNSLSGYTDDYSFIWAFKPIDHKIYTNLELNRKNISDWMHQFPQNEQ